MDTQFGEMQAGDSRPIDILDTTLRDGSYAVDFQFDDSLLPMIMSGLDSCGIGLIELGHGIGIEAERAGAPSCNISLSRWCELAALNIKNAGWGVFAQPSFTRLETLEKLCANGMSFVRVGVEIDALANSSEYLTAVAEICDDVYLNLMKTSDADPEDLPMLFESVPRDVSKFYVVDSYGAMVPQQVKRYVSEALERFEVVGFHGHDNLGLANANGLAAISAGATVIDGTLHGIGRGSGNSATEALAGILVGLGQRRHNYEELARLADSCRKGMQVVDCDRYLQILGGVIGVHTGLFPLVAELCEELTVNPAVLMEKAVSIAPQGPRECDVRAAAKEITHENA